MSTPVTLGAIEEAAKQYSIQFAALKELTTELHNELNKIARLKIGRIKNAANGTAAAQAALLALIEAAPELFVKPQTLVIHGVKVGYKKPGKGSVEWDDDVQVIKRIRKHMTEEQADVLIVTEEHPSADALRNLPAADLAKIGCRIETPAKTAVAAVVTDDVEKLVVRLIDEQLKEAAQAA